jgi:integrase/recombinase XerD
MKQTRFDRYIPEFAQFLQQKGYAPRTVESYIGELRHFFRYIEEEKPGIERIDLFTRKDAVDYQISLYTYETPEGKKYSVGTQIIKLVAVKTFFHFLVTRDYLLFNPAADLELPKEPKTLPRNILTEKEIVEILQVPDMNTFEGIRDRAIIEVLYSTGIRVTECSNLTVYDVQEEEGILRINEGKGRKDRLVAIGKTALRYLRLYLEEVRPKYLSEGDDSSILFLKQDGGKLSRRDFSRYLARIIAKTEIKKDVTCHTFRHTCATHLLKHRANIRYIQQQLGHTSLQTTQKYLQVEISDVKAVHRRCHPREKMG